MSRKEKHLLECKNLPSAHSDACRICGRKLRLFNRDVLDGENE